MQKLSLIILCLLSLGLAQGQDRLFPIRIDNKWGFVNSNGAQVIEPKYDAVGEFGRNSYTNMLLDGTIGLVHKNGEEVFIPGVTTLRVMNDSSVAVKKDTIWGVVDMQGNYLLPIKYSSVGDHPGGYFEARKGDSMGLFSRNSKPLLPCRFKSIQFVEARYIKALTKDSVYYFNSEANVLLQGGVSQFQDTWWPVVIDNGSGDKRTILNVSNGIRSSQFVSATYVKRSSFVLNTGSSTDVFYNAANGDSFPIPSGSSVSTYASGFYKYYKGGKVGILNGKGQVVINAIFDEIDLRNSLFLVNNNGAQGLYTTSGNEVLKTQYENISWDNSGLILLQQNSLLGCAKPSGRLLLAPVFQKVQIIDRQLRGDYGGGQMAFIEFDNSWNITDRYVYKNVKTVFLDFGRVNGPVVSQLSNLDSSRSRNSSQSLPPFWFKSKINGKWGFRRADSTLRHQPRFDLVKHFPQSGFTITYERVPGNKEVKILDGYYYQTRRSALAYTANGNYFANPKYWYIYPHELAQKDAAYVKVLTYTGNVQVIRFDGGPLKKNFTFVDTLVEDMARFNVDGNIVVNEDNNYRTNVFTQIEYRLFNGFEPGSYPFSVRQEMSQKYVRFDYGKWGYLSKDGNIAIEASFDFVYPFKGETAIVKVGDKWGVINKKGEYLIKPVYWNIKRIEYEGDTYFHVFKKQARFGVIDKDGNTVVYPEYLKADNFRNGKMAVKFKKGWTFIDSSLSPICAAQFEEVMPFSNNRAAVQKNGKWGFINAYGDMVIMATYNKVLPFHNNRAWVMSAGNWYLVDEKGYKVVNDAFKSPTPFKGGVAFAQTRKNREYGLVNTDGDFIVKPQFERVSPFNKHGVAIVEANSRSALIDLSGEMVTKPEFARIDSFSCGWAAAQTMEKTVLLHYSGRVRDIAQDYTLIEPFNDGVARVTREALYGYLDTSGNEIMPCELSKARAFSEGQAFIQRKGFGTQCIDTKGKVLFSIRGWISHDYKEGKAILRKDRQSFYINKQGQILFDQGFRRALPFKNGIGRVKIDKRWAVINEFGQMLNSPKFVRIKTFNCNTTVVKRSGSYGLFDEEGNVVLDVMYDEMKLNEDRYYFISVEDKVGHFDLEGQWVWEPSR